MPWLRDEITDGLAEAFEIVGGSSSVTVTANEQLASGPAPFDAVQVTALVPMGKTEPDPGVRVTVGVGAPGALITDCQIRCVSYSNPPMYPSSASKPARRRISR